MIIASALTQCMMRTGSGCSSGLLRSVDLTVTVMTNVYTTCATIRKHSCFTHNTRRRVPVLCRILCCIFGLVLGRIFVLGGPLGAVLILAPILALIFGGTP